MRALILVAGAALAVSACATTSAPPVVGQACTALHSDKFDLALKAYGAAVDAVNLLINAKVLVPGTPRALAVANANDKVLVAFSTAQRARTACDATSYAAAISEASAAIGEIRSALHS